jgi:hypothetical protein
MTVGALSLAMGLPILRRAGDFSTDRAALQSWRVGAVLAPSRQRDGLASAGRSANLATFDRTGAPPPMIIEIVSFTHRAGQTRAEILDQARAVAPNWQANPDLIRKHFLLGENGAGGGVYLWPSREAAERAHGPEWRAAVRQRTGSEPTMTYFEVIMTVDNERGTVTEPAGRQPAMA